MKKSTTISRYSIIDQSGSFDEKWDVEAIYERFFQISAEEGYKYRTYTLKKFCKKNWKGRKEMTDQQLTAMKWAMRNQKFPEKVYLLCEEYNLSAKQIAEAWADRVNIVQVYEFSTGETFRLDLTPFADGEIPPKRRCAQIWAAALGWEFSAPIWRESELNDLDTHMKRPDRKEMMSDPATAAHITKTIHRCDSFRNYARAICPDEEIDEFYEFWKTANQNHLLKEILDPDWTIYKKMPARINMAGEIVSDYHDTKISDDQFELAETTRYYDDSFNDDDDGYLD